MTPSALFALSITIPLALFAGHTIVRAFRTRREAAQEWAFRSVHRSGEVSGLSEAQFRRAYIRAHGPRGQLYALGVLAAAAVVTPLALMGLAAVWRVVWMASGSPPMFSHTTLIWQFYMFFGLIACWVVVAAVFARAYHGSRSGALDQELHKARLSS